MKRSILVASFALLVGCGGGGAVKWDPMTNVPASSQHLQVADPNDPAAFYELGVSLLGTDAQKAADAFYWSARLDPTWAEPLYARRLALLLASPDGFSRYYFQESRSFYESPGVQRLDSLYRRALMLNPVLQPALFVAAYRIALARYIASELRRQNPGAPIDRGAIEYEIELYWRSAEPEVRALLAYAEGRFDDAVDAYRSAINRLGRNDPERPWLEAELGRVLFRLARYDEAKQSFARAVTGWRGQDEQELVRIYESKALYEHAIGLAEEAQQNLAAAREAYARALQEDLSYFPAHIRLGEVALAMGDTATAIAELALAAEAAGDDAGARFHYGRLLAAVNRGEEAERELRRAIELEPLFAEPYLVLGQVLDREPARAAEAAAAYAQFLERARRSHSRRPAVEARLRTLRASTGVPQP